jgi:hypothetical protein
MRNIYRSKLSKRVALGGLFFWKTESKMKHKFDEICSRFCDFTIDFFFIVTSECKRKIQRIKGGNISLPKSSSSRRRESKRKRKFDKEDTTVGF